MEFQTSKIVFRFLARCFRSCKIPYWFLRIHDAPWLHRQFPKLIKKPLPSIYADRKKINNIFHDTKLSPKERHLSIVGNSAGMRSLIRDHTWLCKKLTLLQDEKTHQNNESLSKSFEQRSTKIEIALQYLIREEDEPKLIHAKSLGAIAGLTFPQTSKTIRANPKLQSIINAVNKDKMRRQLLLAIRKLLADNYPLHSNSICKLARLPRSAKATFLIQQIITNLNQHKM
jgi:hypothetical protein